MVFVTGGTGFLGAYVIWNLVQKGQAVRAIRRSAAVPFFVPPCILEKVEWVDGDVLDIVSLQQAMQGVDAVIHAAAVVSFHREDRRRMYQTNIEGTTNVVNAAVEAGIRRFVHVSSVAALGRTTKQENVSEDRKWEENKNNTHYAISKRHAELEAWRGFAEGLEGVIVNPSTILGFGNWHHSSCAIFKNVYRGFPWYTEGVNGFVGVADAAEAVVQLLHSTVNQKRLILNGDNWSFRQLLETIAHHFQKEKPHRRAGPLMSEFAWRLEKLKAMFSGGRPLLTMESARVAHSKTGFNNAALLQALPGFSFTPLEQVIADACTKYIDAVATGRLRP